MSEACESKLDLHSLDGKSLVPCSGQHTEAAGVVTHHSQFAGLYWSWTDVKEVQHA